MQIMWGLWVSCPFQMFFRFFKLFFPIDFFFFKNYKLTPEKTKYRYEELKLKYSKLKNREKFFIQVRQLLEV